MKINKQTMNKNIGLGFMFLDNPEKVRQRYFTLQIGRLGRMQGSTVEELNNCDCLKCQDLTE